MSERRRSWMWVGLLGLVVIAVPCGMLAFHLSRRPVFAGASSALAPRSGHSPASPRETVASPRQGDQSYRPRIPMDLSGTFWLQSSTPPWDPNSPLEAIGRQSRQFAKEVLVQLDRELAASGSADDEINILLRKSCALHSEGAAEEAYATLVRAQALAQRDPAMSARWRYMLVYALGVAGLRQGENENCIMCRGECSCILPIAPSAIHQNREGSRLAVRHFMEYLQQFPNDLEVRWLLNLAHMTLGEHPQLVDPRFLVSLERFENSEFDIGRFRDIGALVGVNRLNQAGGGIMDDFDNDGLLDLITTSWDPSTPMTFYHNEGNGKFQDRTQAAGITNQLGGLYCVQTDFNNDGWLDVYIPRAAWLTSPIRPTLLRNERNGSFTDVTAEAGLLDPVNSNSACWADYDNDGWLDLFVCCEKQSNRLYRNTGQGTFENVSSRAGLEDLDDMCKGANWIDFDNDGYPDLFTNYLTGASKLWHNERDGTFRNVSRAQGVLSSRKGFSCWSWDYDNDGWLDLLATCYNRTLEDVVRGILGETTDRPTTRLFRNLQGKGFQDVSHEAGVDLVFATMGSNFGDFDNDGYLDFYLATGEPNLATLVPNRMFKNVSGKRFAEITGTSGTGHLQKGHSVACGDWDRDGDLDIFVEMGGAVNGDKYHNILFQNPGQGNNWLSIKLIGEKSNRAAIGGRIKVVTTGQQPLTVCRHVSSGSSFGANTLEQHIGLGKADGVARLEIYWPTSRETQVFHDLAVNQGVVVTEFAKDYQQRTWKPIALPE